MNDEKIWEIITQAMVEEFEIEPGQMIPEAQLKDDLGMDSLDMVDMVIVLEVAFNFKIQNKVALTEIKTVGDVVDFIKLTIEGGQDKAVNHS